MRAPRLGVGPKPQNARIAKSKATAVHNILKNIVPLSAAISPFLCSGTIWLWSLDESVGAYDTTTRFASCYIQTATLPAGLRGYKKL